MLQFCLEFGEEAFTTCSMEKST